MKGFFPETSLSVITADPMLPQCGKCGLLNTCKTPKMPVAGMGKRKIMIVGEAPGASEDAEGKPFVGISGQRLQRALRKCGIELFRDCWVTNALSCRPPDNKIDSNKKIDYCRPLVLKAINEHKPVSILVVGQKAVQSVIGNVWAKSIGPMERWVGLQIPARKWNCWITPVYHPSFLMRMHDDIVLERSFDSNVSKAVRHDQRPWKNPGYDFQSDCKLLFKQSEACEIESMASCKLISWDYETTTLNPDSPHAEILSCSISDGKTSIAYPFIGKFIDATEKVLCHKSIKKIGANIKFEERWTRKKLGVRVRGWIWDTVLAAHAIDPRSGITSVKFQAFMRLGVPDWSSSISPYLEGNTGIGPNKIKEVDLRKLLMYNALDSLFEYKIAMMQSKELGVDLEKH